LRFKRVNKRRKASRYGAAWSMPATPKSGVMSKSDRPPTRSTHNGGLTSRNVRSSRSLASSASKLGLNRRDAGSAHAGLCFGLSRMRGNSHVRFLGEGVAATSLSYPTSASEKFTSISTVKSTRRGFDTSMGRHRTAACRSSAAPKVREQPKSSGLRLCRSNRLDNPAPHAHSADKMKEPAGPVRRRRSALNHPCPGPGRSRGHGDLRNSSPPAVTLNRVSPKT